MSNSAKRTVYDKWSSVEIEPGVRCSSFSPNGQLISTAPEFPNIRTTLDAFRHGLGITGKGQCLGWRSGDSYQWWSYEDVAERVRQLCAAFKAKIPLPRQDLVGIYAGCVPQWIVCALALNARSLCYVPIYDTLGLDGCLNIINQTEMKVLFADTPTAVSRILDSAKEIPALKTIITFCRDLTADLIEKAKSSSISLITLEDFVSGVDPNDTDVYDEPNAEDTAVVQYTSGTTGMPKGVVLTHRAFVADVMGVDYPFQLNVDPVITLSSKDVALMYLPLAHMYAQVNCLWFFYRGASIGFFGGNILKIVEDAQILKPTFMATVPRIMNRVYTKVKSTVGETGFKARLFWYCYNRKKALLNQGIITRSSIWDYIAFRRIQGLLGGNVRTMSVGSAPISAEVLEFWRICFGAIIAEGYGQTECTVVSMMAIGPVGGNVGHPLACNYVKLLDVEECGYFVDKDGKGEICIKGPNVMTGYYKQPDKTAEALDADGWLHTGDIGSFLPDGSLRIFDRKKHIFKLAQGEYIAPEKIENVYVMSPLITQVFVDGSSLESFTVAIVVPDVEATASWAKANNASPETVTKNPDFLRYIYDEMIKVGKENKLNSLEQVKNIYVTSEAFSTANGLLTPSMKNRRPQLRRLYQDKIDAMYQAGPLISEASGGNNNKIKEK